MSRTVAFLLFAAVGCSGRHDARSSHQRAAPPAAPRPVEVAVPVTLACGHVHAELPPTSHVTNLEPCLLPWNGVDRAEGEGFVGGGSALHVALEGCTSDVYVEQTAVDVPVPPEALSHGSGDERAPAFLTFEGQRSRVSVTAGVLSGPLGCGETRDRVLRALAESAAVDAPPPPGHARFVVAGNTTSIAIEVPEGYVLGYVGTELDRYVTAWRLSAREAGAPDVSFTTFHDVNEDGSRPRHRRMPTLETHRLFGRIVAMHARAPTPANDVPDVSGNRARPEPCVAAMVRVGDDALMTNVSVCGPDGPQRQRLFEVLAAALVTRR